MEFAEEINYLEEKEYDEDYIIIKGDVPILFSSPHTMVQVKENNEIKLNEPYTKAIALYLASHFNTYACVKIKDTGQDSNHDNHDDYKKDLYNLVKDNNIKLVIDLHGAKKSHDFDVELGTLNNLTADFSTIKELEEAFKEKGILNIQHNDPFKGGAITQYLYNLKEVDAIQLEINFKYRDKDNLDNLKLLCEALSKFIEQYLEYIRR